MSIFKVQVLAEATIRYKQSKLKYKDIISVLTEVEGDIKKDVEYIEHYTREEWFYNYDLKEAKPIDKEDFLVINACGECQQNKKSTEIEKIERVLKEEIIEVIE